MESLTSVMERLGATVADHHGIATPTTFARPGRAHQAVRHGVGVTRHPWGVMVVTGEDRRSFLDDTLTCRVPAADGEVAYGLLLDPDGRIEADLYVVAAEDRLVCLTAPGTVSELVAELDERTFIQDVAVEDATDELAVLGVHGVAATPKLASVMPSGQPPGDGRSMTRAVIRDVGVTLVRLGAPTGEPGVAVICRHDEAGGVFDALVSLGSMATPLGLDTWHSLTLEAGTPLFEPELAGRTPNVCGQLPAAVALDKGCFIGQEVVARIANLGAPRERLAGITADTLPTAPGEIETDVGRAGQLTRRAAAPTQPGEIGLAVLPAELTPGTTVHVEGVAATVVSLPFDAGSEGSARLPVYDEQPT